MIFDLGWPRFVFSGGRVLASYSGFLTSAGPRFDFSGRDELSFFHAF